MPSSGGRQAGIPHTHRCQQPARSRDSLAARDDLTQAGKLALSAGFVEHFLDRGFRDIVVSAKAHDVMTTVDAYRSLSQNMPEVPLHIGVTEAGGVRQGTVKSAAGLACCSPRA